MEYDQTGETPIEDSADSPQLPTPIQIAQPEENGSFFAEWFKVVDPNAPILEDQYFGRSGWALEPDNFADGRQLDDYLKSDHVLYQSSDPTILSLEGFASDEGSESSTDESEDVPLERELPVLDLGPLGMKPLESDWSKMPPLLPSIADDEPLEVLELQPQISDWSEMPELLPPLPMEASLSVPELHKTSSTSDYVFVDPVVPYYGQTVPPSSYGAQAPGLFTGQYTGQMVPLYQTPPVYHLPCFVLGSTQLSFV